MSDLRRRKQILAGLALAVCVAGAWLGFRWMTHPEMQPDFTVDLGGGVMLEMVWIPGGTFEMGSEPTTYERAKKTVAEWFGKTVNLPYIGTESPAHEVTLDGCWMGKYEVTQTQYEKIMGKNPSSFKGLNNTNNPVDLVSWNDATEFCRKLSAKTSQTFTLPSEAQWEYACRAGSKGRYCFGDSESQLEDYAWYGDTTRYAKTHPVGGKKPNAWGLYDMHGNVCEWCQDYSHSTYNGAPDNGRAWEPPESPADSSFRMIRGGSWGNDAEECRSSARTKSFPPDRSNYWGFRVVRTQK